MAKKLDKKELSNVNGGVIQPTIQPVLGKTFKCDNPNCNATWDDNISKYCPKCSSTHFHEVK